MPDVKQSRKLASRAKVLLLEKEIPAHKMELVRSLMSNPKLSEEERYSAIIELIRNCPDKQAKRIENKSSDLPTQVKPKIRELPPVQTIVPSSTALDLARVTEKYRATHLFKKRYLAHSVSRLFFTIKKRLIPTRNLLLIIERIQQMQQKLSEKIAPVLLSILSDEENIQPVQYNYLKGVSDWLSNPLLTNTDYQYLKWLRREYFENELHAFTKGYFSFMELDVETREQLITIFDSKLRQRDEFLKAELKDDDTESVRRQKEKQNLRAERGVYDYIMLLRSFLPTNDDTETMLASMIRRECGLPSMGSFLCAVYESLALGRESKLRDISRILEVAPPVVRSDRFDASLDLLKKYGKDPDSLRRKKLAVMRENYIPYQQLVDYCGLKERGQSLILRCFEDQWVKVRKKKQDATEIYLDDFFTFVEESVNYFLNSYSVFLNGSFITYRKITGETVNLPLFNEQYFYRELQQMEELLNEIHFYRSSNPRTPLSHDEVLSVLKGRLTTFSHIERFLRLIGELYYDIGKELQRIINRHLDNIKLLTEEWQDREIDHAGLEKEQFVISCSKYAIIDFNDRYQLLDKFKGAYLLGENYLEGILPQIAAFCFQLAHECRNETLFNELEDGKNFLKEIRTLER